MMLRDFATSLRYRFAKIPPNLPDVVRRGDVAMAAHILNHHADHIDAMTLGLGLIWAGDDAGSVWQDVVEQIRRHPAAPGICQSVIVNGMTSAARRGNEAMVAMLLTFPQVAVFTARDWDGVLFECLPLGDPEKKRIEPRNFIDRDGHPGILARVREVMSAQNNSARQMDFPRPGLS